MNDPVRIHRLAATDCHGKFLAALSTPARGKSSGIFSDNSGNAEDIPHSVAPIAFVLYLGRIVGWET